MQEDKQVQGMVDFIERDAHEKARELEEEATAQYNSEKANYVEVEKKKVLAQFEKNKKQVEVGRRVAAAGDNQQQRMRVLDERRELLDQLRERVKAKITAIIRDPPKYSALLEKLLKQAAVDVRADAQVIVRQQDVAVVTKLLKSAEDEVFKRANVRVKLTVDTSTYLNDEQSWGGVTLLGFNKQITCENTLARRALHVFDEQLPTIRYQMFHDAAKF